MAKHTAARRAELLALHATFCGALGDPKRLQIVDALRDGELTVGQLADAIGARQANASQHLAVLRQRGLVRARRVHTSVYYRLTDARIVQAVDLLCAAQADLHAGLSAAFADEGGVDDGMTVRAV
jgi:ArsR family transcriptional regulator